MHLGQNDYACTYESKIYNKEHNKMPKEEGSNRVLQNWEYPKMSENIWYF